MKGHRGAGVTLAARGGGRAGAPRRGTAWPRSICRAPGVGPPARAPRRLSRPRTTA